MGRGGDEVEPVSFEVGHHGRLYQEIDGGYKMAGSVGLERVNDGLFPL